ncbi:MAG: DUF4062 domain-containing protein [Gammaproteobacteria bacterium]|nr:DUF4062 domain-containing protein [Gammaproteobacteria bacterium]
MARVFVSSVVKGMEEYRHVAREAITTMGHTPVMFEDFSAKPYSSEQACLHEVEQSDIYLVIAGQDYGHETPEGLSVTQAEFRAAKAANKSILAFIQQVDARDERQQQFLSEIEAYQGGVFRASFSSALKLNNEIIKALRSIETMSQAITEDDFKARITTVLEGRHSYQEEPELIMAFLPQPERMVDIVTIEQEMDDQFGLLCQAGMTRFRDGYELLDHANWTGITSGENSVHFCADGMILFACNPIQPNDGFLGSHFAPPAQIASIAKGFRHIISAQSGFAHMAMHHMESSYVADPPQGASLTLRMSGDHEAEFSHLFTPLTEGTYNNWVDHCINRLSRIFRYNSDQ